MRLLVGSLLCTSLVVGPSAAGANPACGDEAQGGVVALSADLDCTGLPGPALVLRRAVLRLNGFAVRGGDGVLCAERCKVLGPGDVRDSAKSGIWSNLRDDTRYAVAKVHVHDNAGFGIAGWVGASAGHTAIALTDSTVEGNGLAGVAGDERIAVSRSTVRGNGTVNGGAGISAVGGSVRISRSAIADNLGAGVSASRDVSVANSSITGNAEGGVVAGSACILPGVAALKASTVTGNSTPACAPGDCADVASCGAPLVKGSACDTSHQIASGLPGAGWGVCAAD